MVATPSRRSVSSYVGSLRPPSRRLTIYTLPYLHHEWTHPYNQPAHLHTPQSTHEKKNCSKVSFNLPTHESIPTPPMYLSVCPDPIHPPYTCWTSYKYISFIYKRQKRPLEPIMKSTHEKKRSWSQSIHSFLRSEKKSSWRHKWDRRHG